VLGWGIFHGTGNIVAQSLVCVHKATQFEDGAQIEDGALRPGAGALKRPPI